MQLQAHGKPPLLTLVVLFIYKFTHLLVKPIIELTHLINSFSKTKKHVFNTDSSWYEILQLQQQFEMLSTYVEEPLVTNQGEISPYCLEHFENGSIDFFCWFIVCLLASTTYKA